MIDINDNVTDDVTADNKIPEIKLEKVDWNDKADVMSAADFLSMALEPIISETVQKLQDDPFDGSSEALMLVLAAFQSATERVYDTIMPMCVVDLEDKRGKWIPELLGVEDMDEVVKLTPDIDHIRQAKLKAHAIGEPVPVHLEDADVDILIGEPDMEFPDDEG